MSPGRNHNGLRSFPLVFHLTHKQSSSRQTRLSVEGTKANRQKRSCRRLQTGRQKSSWSPEEGPKRQETPETLETLEIERHCCTNRRRKKVSPQSQEESRRDGWDRRRTDRGRGPCTHRDTKTWTYKIREELNEIMKKFRRQKARKRSEGNQKREVPAFFQQGLSWSSAFIVFIWTGETKGDKVIKNRLTCSFRSQPLR